MNKEMSAIAGTKNHPNTEYHKGKDEQILLLRQNVDDAWGKKYRSQGTALLVWPEALGKEFIDVVKGLRPIEAHVTFPAEREILKPQMRELYRNYIDEEIAQTGGVDWGGVVGPIRRHGRRRRPRRVRIRRRRDRDGGRRGASHRRLERDESAIPPNQTLRLVEQPRQASHYVASVVRAGRLVGA